MSRIAIAVFIFVAAGGCRSRPLDEREPPSRRDTPDAGSSPRREPAGVGPLALAAGNATACALAGDGTVSCWGDNGRGQLGDGRGGRGRATPGVVGGLDGVTALAGGGDHFCALVAGGSVRCWGANDRAQLGVDDTRDRDRPVAAATRGWPVALAAGAAHGCALVEGDVVECWGANEHGQCGAAASSYMPPVGVAGLRGVRALGLSGDTSCALTRDDRVWCWGALDGRGQEVPVERAALAGARAIAVGEGAVCALFDDGVVRCDGDVPAAVGALPRGELGVLLGATQGCAVAGDHVLRCWDGAGTAAVAIPGLRASSLALGGDFACAGVVEGGVYCWGANNSGQLGDGTYTSRTAPTRVLGL